MSWLHWHVRALRKIIFICIFEVAFESDCVLNLTIKSKEEKIDDQYGFISNMVKINMGLKVS